MAAKKAGVSMDAIAMFEADHKQVQKAFKDFEKLNETGKRREKAAVVQQTCADLTVHTKVEEQTSTRRSVKQLRTVL